MLILAVEPDSRQAKELAALVEGRLGAELVLVDSPEAALAWLRDRVPDLVLTSALVSGEDEAAIVERLQSLGDAASHVQTLTIPALPAPKPVDRGRGVLAALGWSRRATPVDGCDPAAFAAQCAASLERARTERERRQRADDEPHEAAPVVEPVAEEEAAAAESELHRAIEALHRELDAMDLEDAGSRRPIALGAAHRDPEAVAQGDRRRFDPEQRAFSVLVKELEEVTAAAHLRGADLS